MLEVAIARKVFARRRAAADERVDATLRDVRFSAAGGEVLALFGPSGVGKTTLLRIVLGLDADFQGRVRRPQGAPGVMFQEARLVPWLSVAENLRFVAPAAGEAEIGAVLAQVGLPGIQRLRPGELSLGMARRVALARALIVAPRWLVLDEPFSSLDPESTAALARTIAAYAAREGAPVLLSTHEIDLALAIADRVLVMSGRPATLALDLPVGARSEAGLRHELLARFPFLRGAVAAPEPTVSGE